MNEQDTENWKPKIVAFLCNWCSYAGADLAGGSRLKYPANIRIIRVPCSARMDPKLVLKALEKGADGVLVSGCHPGDCHYTEGNYHARRRMAMFRKLVEFIGVDPEHRGKGLGTALMQPVLERCDREGCGAYLENSNEVNTAYYERRGFKIVDEIDMAHGAPPLWPMWRDPQ